MNANMIKKSRMYFVDGLNANITSLYYLFQLGFPSFKLSGNTLPLNCAFYLQCIYPALFDLALYIAVALSQSMNALRGGGGGGLQRG